MNPEIDISCVVLHTKRLTLRPWRQEDLEDFYAYASVDGVGQMAGWAPHKSREESVYRLNRFIEGKKTFALEHDGKVIGSLGIERYNEADHPELETLRCREIGYVLSKDYWGQGLMPEAVERVLQYLFEQVELDAVLCGHFLQNRQSARVQEKCGFTYCKTVPYTTQMGTVVTSIDNIMTREQWMNRNNRQGGKKMYTFYGWQGATVQDDLGLTPRDYYDILTSIWSRETCAPRLRPKWSMENQTLGQCSITAFAIQDIYGGKVLGVALPEGGYHCFNQVGDCIFDLTSEQFGDEKLCYDDCPQQYREDHFADPDKKARYELLKGQLLAKRKR